MNKSTFSIRKNLIILLSLSIGCVYADQDIVITGGNSAGNPKLAIVNFTNEDGSISNEITNDFKITGEFNVSNYVSSDAVDSTAQYTISGNVNTDPVSGQMQVQYQLINNTTKEVLLNQTAAFNQKSQRKAIHTMDNNVSQKLTTTPGAFTSKMAILG